MHSTARYLYPLPIWGTFVSIAAAPALFGFRFFTAFFNSLRGERETFRARVAVIAHFFVACHWARTFRKEPPSLIHSQWAHSCATIGMFGAWLLDTPFSFTGHACDLFRDRVALRTKIARAKFIVCISEFHRRFYLKEGADPEQLVLAYCGIDPSVFVPVPEGTPHKRKFQIRASGRLVEKKGLKHLIKACEHLRKAGIEFHCTIGGSGPLEHELLDQVKLLELSDCVTITGAAIKQEQIAQFMHAGDVFCLPCVWASDGDVDGLPQMLMEAMACGLPVISTYLVGIPDLVLNEVTGLLVDPENSEQLAAALERLHNDVELRSRLAEAGRAYVLEKFDIRNCLDPLFEKYRDCDDSAKVAARLPAVPSACST